ncbi:hypothetical protein EBT23_07000 [bacterium]|nr:hypothetical protein [bacterium]
MEQAVLLIRKAEQLLELQVLMVQYQLQVQQVVIMILVMVEQTLVQLEQEHMIQAFQLVLHQVQ